MAGHRGCRESVEAPPWAPAVGLDFGEAMGAIREAMQGAPRSDGAGDGQSATTQPTTFGMATHGGGSGGACGRTCEEGR